MATKGAKQIVEENISTLNFYRNMIFGALGIYFILVLVLFEFTTLIIVSIIVNFILFHDIHFKQFIITLIQLQTLTIFSAIVYGASYQFMTHMARATYLESGQLLDSGLDLNIEGGIGE